jgi:PleD family two-component response regulator
MNITENRPLRPVFAARNNASPTIAAILSTISHMGWQTVVMDNLGFGKVLLVEDDERLATLIAHFLEQHGYEVRGASRRSGGGRVSRIPAQSGGA